MTTLFVCTDCAAEYAQSGTCEVCDVELVERDPAEYGLGEEEEADEDWDKGLTEGEDEEEKDGLEEESIDELAEEEDDDLDEYMTEYDDKDTI